MVTLEQIQDNLPKYLTPGEQAELFSQLRDFEHRSYYTNLYASETLQGDGWPGIEIINFSDGARDKVKGILLSNSCDIDFSNSRDLPPRVVFAPLVRLDLYIDLLKRSGLADEQIGGKVDAIRRQRVTSLFYLPRGGALDSDHIAVLDDLHNIPLSRFLTDSKSSSKLFTLGQMGLYLFLLKLSIHFCRFQEAIARQ